MQALALWIEGVLVPALGPFGLYVAAILDSFLFLPELNDVLVVSAAAARPGTAWLGATMVTLGSVSGCCAIWWAGVRGGEPLLERRLGRARMEKTRDAFQRWDLLALAVAALLPPPVPFKAFVLSAGVFGVSFRRFTVTVLLARGARYAFWSVMGMLYGQEAVELLRAADRWFKGHAAIVLAIGTAGLLAASAWYYLRRRARATQ